MKILGSEIERLAHPITLKIEAKTRRAALIEDHLETQLKKGKMPTIVEM